MADRRADAAAAGNTISRPSTTALADRRADAGAAAGNTIPGPSTTALAKGKAAASAGAARLFADAVMAGVVA
ncbi:MAG: hypothetical protein K2X49_05895 [Acetobacteraceae bacterium]|nr:hypothetical protein [Acetobacteraceae bacterium]